MVLTLAALMILSLSPSFDVVSIKPNKSGARALGNKFEPKRMMWTNTSLRFLIQTAYRIQSYQLLGGPAWLTSETWDIDATTESPSGTQQKMEMLQTLLSERFQLKLHRETRNLQEYKLVTARSGPKLRPAKDADPDRTRIARGLIENRHMNIADLAGWLKGELGRPVTDGTGLSGSFDVRLEWVPDEGQPNSQGVAPAENPAGPTIFSALQEQLGLKLEARKGPVEVLVVDHVEKPSAD